MIADKNELLQIAHAFEQDLVAQRITEEQATALVGAVVPALKLMAGSSGSDGSKAIEPLLPLLTQDIITALQLLGFNFRKALGEPLRQLLADFPSFQRDPNRAAFDAQEGTPWELLRNVLGSGRNSGTQMLARSADGGDEFVGGAEGEAGNGAVDVADDAVFVDDEHASAGEAQRAEGAVGVGDGFVGVGQEREGETKLLGELFVAVETLAADGQHLRADVLELAHTRVVAVELLGADRGVICWVEHQHERLAPELGE